MLDANEWRGEEVNWLHLKVDGHRVEMRKDEYGAVRVLTTELTDVTEMARSYPWYANFVRRAPPGTVVEGELHVPGRPASAVSTARAQRDPALRLAAFAVPSAPHDAPLSEVACALALWGLECPRYYRYRGQTADTLLRALPDGAEGWVLKVANYVGWYKLKRVRAIDLVVTGTKDGDGKYLGAVGALLCSVVLPDGSTREVASVGSGFTDEERWDLDERAVIGQVAEVSYQYVGARGRLRHPRFSRWRGDKDRRRCGPEQDAALEEYLRGLLRQDA